MSWLTYALISAVSAAATAILAKIGVEGVPAALATAIRTLVVVACAWTVVFGLDQHRGLSTTSTRTVIVLVLSGVTTAVSWLAYFQALRMAPASWVAPIDKLSLPFTIVLAAILLRETVTWPMVAGVMLMVIGALITRA